MPSRSIVLNLRVQVGAFPADRKRPLQGGLFLVGGVSGSLGQSVGSKPVKQCNEHRRGIILLNLFSICLCLSTPL